MRNGGENNQISWVEMVGKSANIQQPSTNCCSLPMTCVSLPESCHKDGNRGLPVCHKDGNRGLPVCHKDGNKGLPARQEVFHK